MSSKMNCFNNLTQRKRIELEDKKNENKIKTKQNLLDLFKSFNPIKSDVYKFNNQEKESQTIDKSLIKYYQ